MTNGITLRNVEKLAQRLPLAKQLELISRLSQRLNARPIETLSKTAKKTKQQLAEERQSHVEDLLAEADAIAEKFSGKSNVVSEIRRMRAQRDKQILKNALMPM